MELVDVLFILLLAIFQGMGTCLLLEGPPRIILSSWKRLVCMVLLVIMLEEAMFRCVLPLYLPWILCDVLFGLVYLSGLCLPNLYPNYHLCLFQITCGLFLGFGLPKFAFVASTLLHVLYTISLSLIIWGYSCSEPPIEPPFEITVPKRRRSLGPSKETEEERELISIVQLPEELRSLYLHDIRSVYCD